jgi:hypothetical protein
MTLCDGRCNPRTDRGYYDLEVTDTVIVDGDQYYWVQIGKDKAKQLTSNDLVLYICDGGVLFVAGATLVAGEAAIIAGDAATLASAEGVILLSHTEGKVQIGGAIITA